MTDFDEQGRPEPPLAGDELGTLVGFLEYQRATLGWKTAGLDSAGLSIRVGASIMTLGGLLKHMARIEDGWFCNQVIAWGKAPPWDSVDWSADDDWDWSSAADDTPEELRSLWEAAVARSREALAEALADGGLDRLAARTWPDGRAPSLRWVLCPHDRGVRPPQRARRPVARGGRRPDRGVTDGRPGRGGYPVDVEHPVQIVAKPPDRVDVATG